MDIRIIQGDITTAPNGVILHGCNLKGKMGSGVALAIAKKWPKVKTAYMKLFKKEFASDAAPRLGQVQYVKINNKLTVVNGMTQENFGYDGKRYADPTAIANCINSVCCAFTACNTPAEKRRIHLPKIESDRGGLDWELEVMPIIERAAAKWTDVTFSIWEYE